MNEGHCTNYALTVIEGSLKHIILLVILTDLA